MSSIYQRAAEIEKIVQRDYADEDTDAADLALDEIMQKPDRTNEQIARVVAQRILQP